MIRSTRPLGRPRSFDPDDVLERALHVFREDGYGGASYETIEKATGLHRQSLRYAFGDKAALFRRVLDRYAEGKIAVVCSVLERPGRALDNVRAVLMIWAEDAGDPSGCGCLVVNTLAERRGSDDRVVEAASAATERLVGAFAGAFRTAQAQGDVRSDLDPDTLARHVVALGDGFMVHAGKGAMSRFAADVFAGFIAWITPGSYPLPRTSP